MNDVSGDAAWAAKNPPTGLISQVIGYAWSRNFVGRSGGAVYHLHGKKNAPDLFLKYVEGVIADEITDEMTKLR